MLQEFDNLRMSLNISKNPEHFNSDNEETFTSNGKFATFSSHKSPISPIILDDNKLMEKLRNHKELRRSRKSSSSGKPTEILVDANPELLITKRDLLATLMEMKLDPQQVRTICKSLQNKSKDFLPQVRLFV